MKRAQLDVRFVKLRGILVSQYSTHMKEQYLVAVKRLEIFSTCTLGKSGLEFGLDGVTRIIRDILLDKILYVHVRVLLGMIILPQ